MKTNPISFKEQHQKLSDLNSFIEGVLKDTEQLAPEKTWSNTSDKTHTVCIQFFAELTLEAVGKSTGEDLIVAAQALIRDLVLNLDKPIEERNTVLGCWQLLSVGAKQRMVSLEEKFNSLIKGTSQ